MRTTRFCVTILSAISSTALCTSLAQAAEGGTGFYLLGSRGPLAGFTPPPGLYLQNDTYLYSGSANAEIPLGGRLVADVDATVVVDLATLLMVTQYEILGGNLAFTATLPFGGPDINADLTPGKFAVSDDAFTIGDPVLGAFVGWHDGNMHWQAGASFNIPIGDYRDGQLANMSFNHFAADLFGSVTWLNQTNGRELSLAAGVTFNAEDPASDYQNGTEFHLEAAAIQHFGPTFDAGLIGYFYQQLTPDTGAGVPAILDGFEGRVAAIGATAGLNFKLGELPVSARIKYFHEFDVKNRLQGDSGFVTLAVPLAAFGG